MKINEVLHDIQVKIKVPKGQMNKFGGYKYRSCEDIVEGVKSHLPSGCYLSLSDDLLSLNDRVFIKATATLYNDEGSVSVTGCAEVQREKKGMDSAQITGAASSYARKYALNGLLLIDDTKDADSNEQQQQVNNKPASQVKAATKEEVDMMIGRLQGLRNEKEYNNLRDIFTALYKRCDDSYKKALTLTVNKVKKELGIV